MTALIQAIQSMTPTSYLMETDRTGKIKIGDWSATAPAEVYTPRTLEEFAAVDALQGREDIKERLLTEGYTYATEEGWKAHRRMLYPSLES